MLASDTKRMNDDLEEKRKVEEMLRPQTIDLATPRDVDTGKMLSKSPS